MPFKVFGFFSYVLFLVKEIIRSTLVLSCYIWFKKVNENEDLIEIKNQFTNTKKALYSSGITLTPGTFTLDINKDHIIIHSFEKANHEDFINCSIKSKIQKI